jgi:hypothetical protein
MDRESRTDALDQIGLLIVGIGPFLERFELLEHRLHFFVVGHEHLNGVLPS